MRKGLLLTALLALGFMLGLALVLAIGPASRAAEYNLIEGTDCNEWTPDVHEGLGNPDNTRCNTEDLQGTSAADTIHGYQGWDYIVGLGGEDLLRGGGSMDALYAGNGNDTLDGAQGHDHAWGGAGDDYVDVSDGRDEVDRKEEVHGDFKDVVEGTADRCILDNDVGDIVSKCEEISVLRDDGATVTWTPNADASNTPADVLVTVKPPS